MNKRSGSLRHRTVWACLAAVVLIAAPATSASSSSSSGSALKTLTIGTSGDFPPYEFRGANGQVVGFIPDMLKFILPKLGYSYKYVQISFAGLPPALVSERIDMITALYDTPSREKIISFADFAAERDGIIIRKSDVGKIKTFSDLCGKTVGAIVGSPILPVTINGGSKRECVAKGKPAIKTATYQSDAQELHDLANGRIDAGIDGASVFGYAAKQSGGKFALAFVAGAPAIAGWGVKKGNPLLQDLTKGLQRFLSSPRASAVAKKWGLPAGFFLKHAKSVK